MVNQEISQRAVKIRISPHRMTRTTDSKRIPKTYTGWR